MQENSGCNLRSLLFVPLPIHFKCYSKQWHLSKCTDMLPIWCDYTYIHTKLRIFCSCQNPEAHRPKREHALENGCTEGYSPHVQRLLLKSASTVSASKFPANALTLRYIREKKVKAHTNRHFTRLTCQAKTPNERSVNNRCSTVTIVSDLHMKPFTPPRVTPWHTSRHTCTTRKIFVSDMHRISVIPCVPSAAVSPPCLR